jgi:hexosaminidase
MIRIILRFPKIGIFTIPLFLYFLIISCEQLHPTPEIGFTWKLLKNDKYRGIDQHEVIITLENKGTIDLNDKNWSLYWNQAPRVILLEDKTKRIKTSWINGDFYEMKPLKGFKLEKGKSIDLSIVFDGYAIKASDAPMGIYIVDGNAKAHVVTSVIIEPFLAENQMKRGPSDEEPIPSTAYLFAEGAKLETIPAAEKLLFIPAPFKMKPEKGVFTISKNIAIYVPPPFESEYNYLKKHWPGQLTSVHHASDAAILLHEDHDIKGDETYNLEVTEGKIHISASKKAGMFYGITSLLAIIDEENWNISGITIMDKPAYPYRGMQIDVARNFQTKESIFRLLDQMANVKLNKLLLYLTEDEGWRIEIKAFPELTKVGARRGHTTNERLFLQPAYGSGPFPDDKNSNGNGFYTQAEFIEILRYANERHIEIIPEVNFPGHARAAIKAMENRYEKFKKLGNLKEAEKYRLIDPEDASVYRSAQFYTDNIVCACRPSVIAFYEVVLDEFVKMYKEAGLPLHTFHSGGDEVPADAWKGSPICKKYLAENPAIKNTRNLQADLFTRLLPLFEKRNITVGGWEEIVMFYDEKNKHTINSSFTKNKVIPYIWNNLWGQQDLGYKIANSGYQVVLCPVTNTYFDLAYSNDPREPGLYWAGFINEKDAFAMLPENLFYSTRQDDMGKSFDMENDFKDMVRLNIIGQSNILGIQGQLWGETIKGATMLEYYYMPKLLGLAHRAWVGMPEWSTLKDEKERDKYLSVDYNRFIHHVVEKEFKRMDKAENPIHYRIPAPGILQRGDSVFMNSIYPGMEIRYTLDGSEPNEKAALYTSPIKTKTRKIRAKIFNSVGRGGFESEYLLKLKNYDEY